MSANDVSSRDACGGSIISCGNRKPSGGFRGKAHASSSMNRLPFNSLCSKDGRFSLICKRLGCQPVVVQVRLRESLQCLSFNSNTVPLSNERARNVWYGMHKEKS